MTTRIHIVNFGPDVVEASVESTNVTSAPEKIYPSQYKDFYVYDNHDILVKEVKPETEKKS
jgi:hypothetical protein